MGRRRRSSIDLSLDPDTRKALAIVFLFAMGALMLLGLFDLAGGFGRSLDEALAYVFGWDRLFVPFLLFAWAYHVLAPDRLQLNLRNVFGFLLFFVSLNPLVHVITFADPATQTVDSAIMKAGGKLGMIIGEPMVSMLGMAGSITVFIALFVLALLLGFNASLKQLLFFIDLFIKSVAGTVRMITLPFVRWMQSQQEKKAVEEKVVYHMHEQEPAHVEPTTDLEDEEEEQEDPELDDEEDTDEDEEAENEEEDEEVADAPVVTKKRKQPRIDIPLDLLERRDSRPQAGDIVHNREAIRRTLENFGIPVEMNEVSVGPTVTQFAFKPAEGIKLSRITALHNDLALSLAAHPIRIEAPIPGKSQVGVEVPNQTIATVGLRDLIDAKEFKERKSPLTFVLGKDVSGKPWVADLVRMPHMLVAGATGSGKSVCLNVIIMSYLYGLGPDDVKLIMVDPKRVELQNYNGIPHLLTPVITKVPETVNALKWALKEMDRRYDLLAKQGVRDLATFNQRYPQEKMPYIVVIIDELADLMVTSAAEVEGPIVRLAQMSRAVGIHLILATQRPSVDVITGLIKANIPGRIAFSVASAMDSRTILDQQGAEKLLGRGDMLLSTAELAMPKRIQGAFVSESEIAKVVEFVKSNYEPADYDYTVTEKPSATSMTLTGPDGDGGEDGDPLADLAKEEILRAGKASASLLQRRLKVGYARAARILDVLEQEGFIGPADGAKPREILKSDFTRTQDATLSAAVAATADIMDMNTDDEE